MTNFVGDITEESLENKDVLKKIAIISTRVEKVTAEHKTSWILEWTLHFRGKVFYFRPDDKVWDR